MMNKSLTEFLAMLVFLLGSSYAHSQVLNQTADWGPSTTWTLSGTYNPTALFEDPTAVANFGYDDDAAGSGSTDEIEVTSPVIDLTAASNAGETFLKVDLDYVFNEVTTDLLEIDYFDADAATWVLWSDLPENSTSTSDYESCIGQSSFTTTVLDISTFTANQLQNFQYRTTWNGSSVFGWGFCLDPPTITSTPCPSPSALTATNITTTGADLGWTENGTATVWDIEIGLTGFTPTGTPTNAGVANPYTYSSGTANTTYDYYVRADCAGSGGTGQSDWVGPFTFTTLCDVISTLPYVEDFETATGTLNCWEVIDNNADGDAWEISTFNPNSPTQTYLIVTDYNFGDNDDYLISPQITLTGNERLKFSQRVQNTGEPNDFEVLLSTTGTDPADFSNTILANATYNNTSYQEIVVDLSAYSGDVYIAFRVAPGGLDGWILYIDDVIVEEIPACVDPTALTATNITTTGADLGWTENGTATVWDVEIGLTGFTPTGTPTNAGVTNPYTFNTGMANTTYDYYVRADCGASGGSGTSTWVGPFTFTTSCNTISTLPYVEDFETATGTLTCWTVNDNNADGLAWELSTLNPNSPTQTYLIVTDYNNGNNDDYLISPQITLTGNERLKFSQRVQSSFEPNEFEVLLSTTGTDPADFSNTILANASYNNETYQEITVDLSAYSGNVYIAFRVPPAGPDGWILYIDDVIVEEIPACLVPSALTATNITTTGADLGWTENGTATVWDVEIGLTGFTPTGTPTNAGVTNPYTFNTGMANTTYDYYVRADCGVNGTSTWAGPFTFTTLCNAISTFPYVEDFETATGTFTCWTVNNNNADGDAWQLVTSSNANSPSQVYIINTDGNGGNNDDYLISPQLTLTGNEQLRFSQRVLSSFEPNDFEVLLSTTGTDPADFSNTILANASYNNETYQEFTINLSAYSGNVYIAFHVPPGGLDGWVLYIDDVVVEVLPACGDPVGLNATNITGSSFDLNWMAFNGETTFDIYYDINPAPVPDPSTTPTVDDVMATTFNVSGLMAGNSYDAYVRADCSATGNGESGWTGPITVYIPNPNEGCGTATNLPVEVDCSTATPTALDWANASVDLGPVASCDQTTGNYGFWYSFVAPASSNVNIYDDGTTGFEAAVFDACGGNELLCSSSSAGGQVRSVLGLTAGSTYYLVVWRDGLSTATTTICIEAGPVCLDPSGLSAFNETTNGADLTWTENGPGVSSDLEIGVTGFTPTGTPTETGVTSNPYTWTGGTSATTYDFYVRTNCGVEGTSNWVGPFTFTTLCATFLPDYCEEFTAAATPTCWEEAEGGDLSTGPTSTPTAGWAFAEGVVRFNLWNTGDFDWLLTPEFGIVGDLLELKFDVSVTDFDTGGPSNMGSDDVVTLVASTDGGATWTTVQSWAAGSSPSNTGDAITIPLLIYSGAAVKFAFVADEGTTDDPEDYYFNIDNFCVETCPALTYYPDSDMDGFGDANDPGTMFCPGNVPPGFTTDNSDCDDSNSTTELRVDDNPIVPDVYAFHSVLSLGKVAMGTFMTDRVTFRGDYEVVMEPGFQAEEGSDFIAEINTGGCAPVPLSEEEVLTEELEVVPTVDIAEDQFRIYPNPLQDETVFEYTLGEASVVNIMIVDAQGKVVARPLDSQYAEKGVYTLNYNATHLGDGIYTILFNTQTSNKSQRMVIIRN
ncbi:MAG: choice-of-anchor J domain-containing protein [Bacteroidota bacterium]